jgi:heme/copper-type cytochrome/quinol oxidase subunit 2
MRRLPRRLDTWYWRARYWWMDTEQGATAHVVTFVLCALVTVAQVARLAATALHPAPQQQAVVWWVVQLIIVVIGAILSFVLRPKAPKTKEPEQQGPTVEDGITFDNFYGTHWHEDQAMPEWQVVGKKKIKAKAGKK